MGRWVAACVCALGVLGPGAALISACGLAPWAAFAAAGTLSVIGAVALRRRLPRRLDELAASHRAAAVIWTLLAVAGAANLTRVAYFMIDADAPTGSLLPSSEFSNDHSCLTAYYRAAVAERAGAANIYEPTIYFGRDEDPPSAGKIGRFDVDPYEYPPPFLLPARAALAVSDDFMTWRAAWFGIDALLLIAALIALTTWIGGNEGLYAFLLAPAVLCAAPVVFTLQMGNFQLAAIAISLIAMVSIERGRDVAGGALLSTVTVFKLFPGILLVYLLAKRRWRAAGAMCIASAAIVAVTALVFGLGPFHAFLTFQLPRMADGSAFPWLQGFLPAIAVNHSVFGLVIKLHALGVPGMSFGVASKVAWIYTLVAIAIAWMLGRGAVRDRGADALVWLGVLQLGTLRSPFAPDIYAVIAPLWIVVLLAPRVRLGGRVVLALAWVALCAGILGLTVDQPMGDHLRLALTGAVQAVGLVLTYRALRPPPLTLSAR